jgi:hypothetical protein
MYNIVLFIDMNSPAFLFMTPGMIYRAGTKPIGKKGKKENSYKYIDSLD